MKIAVSGSRGYIGGALLPELARTGHDTVGSRFDHDILIHLYALTNLYECERDYRRSLFYNISSLVDACSMEYGRRLIFLSSNTADDHWGETRSVYDKHKRICEEIIQSCPNLDSVILRLDTVYGYSPSESREGRGIINKWIRTALVGGEITVYNGVTNKMRDYVHISDVVSAIVTALTAPKGIYDVSFGYRRSVLNAANTIKEVMGKGTVRVIPDPAGVHPIDYRSLEHPNLKWMPNWTPRVDFIQGVDKTIKDYERKAN